MAEMLLTKLRWSDASQETHHEVFGAVGEQMLNARLAKQRQLNGFLRMEREWYNEDENLLIALENVVEDKRAVRAPHSPCASLAMYCPPNHVPWSCDVR